MKVKIKKLVKDAVVPTYAKSGDAGMDLTAISMEYNEYMDCYIYHTGLSFEIPEGYFMMVVPRSSNRKTNAYLTNHCGIIDSGYRGEVLVCFKNRTSSIISNYIAFETDGEIYDNIPPYNVGDRVAQTIILPYPQIEYVEVDILSETERGVAGHGSTGN